MPKDWPPQSRQRRNHRRSSLRGITRTLHAGCGSPASRRVVLKTLRVRDDDSEKLCCDQAGKREQSKNIIHGVPTIRLVSPFIGDDGSNIVAQDNFWPLASGRRNLQQNLPAGERPLYSPREV